MKQHAYYIYIMSNTRQTAFYTGITNFLNRRYIEHLWKLNNNSFTSKYNINTLLYYEHYPYVLDAIQREKQIKKFRREKKLALIDSLNPDRVDLFTTVGQE